MSNFIPLQPKRPIKKPKPYSIECISGVIFLDHEEGFNEQSEVFCCIDENIPTFELLESGTYNTLDGIQFEVLNGIIIEIA